MARKSKGDSAKPARAKKADVRVVDEQGDALGLQFLCCVVGSGDKW